MYVTIKSPTHELTVMVADTPPTISDGISTWDTVARPKRESFVRYTGRNPHQQSISVMFDGWHDSVSQEGRITKLATMASKPHPVQLSGHALHKHLDWVITNVTWDDQYTIWKEITTGSGKKQKTSLVRVRQAATITFLEYIKDEIIKTPAAPHVVDPGKKPIKKIKVPKGMILKQIAQLEYGDPDKWRLIRDANLGILLGAGPRYFVMAGLTLTIVDGKTPYFLVP
jgi:hypothetical protein